MCVNLFFLQRISRGCHVKSDAIKSKASGRCGEKKSRKLLPVAFHVPPTHTGFTIVCLNVSPNARVLVTPPTGRDHEVDRKMYPANYPVVTSTTGGHSVAVQHIDDEFLGSRCAKPLFTTPVPSTKTFFPLPPEPYPGWDRYDNIIPEYVLKYFHSGGEVEAREWLSSRKRKSD